MLIVNWISIRIFRSATGFWLNALHYSLIKQKASLAPFYREFLISYFVFCFYLLLLPLRFTCLGCVAETCCQHYRLSVNKALHQCSSGIKCLFILAQCQKWNPPLFERGSLSLCKKKRVRMRRIINEAADVLVILNLHIEIAFAIYKALPRYYVSSSRTQRIHCLGLWMPLKKS